MKWPSHRLGVAVPQVFVGPKPDLRHLEAVTRRAESLGLHSLWTQSQVIGRANVIDPLTVLSYAAAVTERILLGTAVINPLEHTPIQLAKQISSLDNLSNGRVILGLGLGRSFEAEGVDMSRPVRRLLETVGVMTALWGPRAATFHGQLWQFDGLEMYPKPLQQPRPRIWLSGRHPNALIRAARRGDGWIGSGASSTSDFSAQVVQVRAALDKMGRDSGAFTIAKRVYLAIDDDQRRVERRVHERFAAYYGDPDRPSRAVATGSADEVSAAISEVFAQGADLVVLHPVFDELEQLDAVVDAVVEDRPATGGSERSDVVDGNAPGP